MNLNILTYFIYLPIISLIMLIVGWLFYTHGEVFLLYLFEQDTKLVKSINNILLIGYYLLNIGYAITSLTHWETVNSTIQMIETISKHLGIIIIGLSILHYNNVICLRYIVKLKTLKQ